MDCESAAAEPAFVLRSAGLRKPATTPTTPKPAPALALLTRNAGHEGRRLLLTAFPHRVSGGDQVAPRSGCQANRNLRTGVRVQLALGA